MPGRPLDGTNTTEDTQRAAKMLKAVGFRPEQIRFLLDEDVSAQAPKEYRRAFTSRQFKTLDTATDLKGLITGGFTRPQAKVLLELGIIGGV